MNNKISRFLEAEQLTPAKFADTLGVQRSSVSHILSGRNKPSLDFIEKMLNKFPQINPDWLISNKGSMYRSSHMPSLFSADNKIADHNTQDSSDLTDYKIETSTTKKTIPLLADTINKNDVKQEKKAVRVIIFYDDQTFEIYNHSLSEQ